MDLRIFNNWLFEMDQLFAQVNYQMRKKRFSLVSQINHVIMFGDEFKLK